MKTLFEYITESVDCVLSRKNGSKTTNFNLDNFAYIVYSLAVREYDDSYSAKDLKDLLDCKKLEEIKQYLMDSKISDKVYEYIEQEGTDGKHFHEIYVNGKQINKSEFADYFSELLKTTNLVKKIKTHIKNYY